LLYVYQANTSSSPQKAYSQPTNYQLILHKENVQLQEENLQLQKRIEQLFEMLTETQKKLISVQQKYTVQNEQQSRPSTSGQRRRRSQIQSSTITEEQKARIRKLSRSLDSIQQEMMIMQFDAGLSNADSLIAELDQQVTSPQHKTPTKHYK